MTEEQIVCALFALPFLTMAAAFVVGLSLIEYVERRNLRRLKAMVRGGRK